MDAISFAYWLNGYFELSGSTELSEAQVQIIKDHLKLVFDKQTPDRLGPVKPAEPMRKGGEIDQDKLQRELREVQDAMQRPRRTPAAMHDVRCAADRRIC